MVRTRDATEFETKRLKAIADIIQTVMKQTAYRYRGQIKVLARHGGHNDPGRVYYRVIMTHENDKNGLGLIINYDALQFIREDLLNINVVLEQIGPDDKQSLRLYLHDKDEDD